MNIAVKGVKHAAPRPYLGFALQAVRFCFHLLDSPKGAKVSLELLDDVAVHYADGSLMLEQTKYPRSGTGADAKRPQKQIIWSGRRDSNPRPQPWQG
ncbi:MAG TPA: hypothetical protein VH684_01070, partial [Xanthobacteraceae bacterium]